MTIKEFMENNNIKSTKKVYSRIEKGFIPGTVQAPETNEYIIPNHAKVPYTKARAKTSTAIYKSIVKACIERKGICAKLYKISEEEFQHYVSELELAGFIKSEVYDNITYFYATMKSEDFINSKSPQKLIEECVKTAVESAAKGATSAVIEKVLVHS